jgi:hypothetical protein
MTDFSPFLFKHCIRGLHFLCEMFCLWNLSTRGEKIKGKLLCERIYIIKLNEATDKFFASAFSQHLERPSPLITIKNLVNKKHDCVAPTRRVSEVFTYARGAGTGEIIYLLNLMVSSIFHAAPSQQRERLCGRYFFQHARSYNSARRQRSLPLVIYLWLIQTGKCSFFKRDTRPERSVLTVKVIQALGYLHWR